MQDIRIAIVTANARLGQTAHNLDRISRWVEDARKADADLICLPELQISGYQNSPSIREWAERVPGPAVGCLETLARNANMTILAGTAEAGAENRLYATHLVVSPEGLCGRYRKTHPGPPEQEIFTPGDTVPLFATKQLRFGLQLCYDAHFPELATSMALKGAEAIFIPHASPGASPAEKMDSWMRHLPARAFDNSLFVIACNQAGDNGAGLSFPGIALALSPSGTVLAAYAGALEHMIIVDLKAADLEAVHSHRMRCFLPNRRPELYRNG
ncbi:MAG TPA: nitrilase-related carbon-nitrogen hydrolase [Desulfosalsimonadaceae bacterium]|nr:nitrilase-related carbon-nitrogen hydrolase [Desulfosalsimonadaceae bacterium]